jgi:hypothetical protein
MTLNSLLDAVDVATGFLCESSQQAGPNESAYSTLADGSATATQKRNGRSRRFFGGFSFTSIIIGFSFMSAILPRAVDAAKAR